MDVQEMDVLERVDTPVKFKNNWKVILYNDDTTNLMFVISVLCQVFEYELADAGKTAKEVERVQQKVIAVLPEKLAKSRVKRSLSLAQEHGYKDFKIKAEEDV